MIKIEMKFMDGCIIAFFLSLVAAYLIIFVSNSKSNHLNDVNYFNVKNVMHNRLFTETNNFLTTRETNTENLNVNSTENPILIRNARSFTRIEVTFSPPTPVRSYRPRLERYRIRCYDLQTATSYCPMQKDLGRCSMQSVIDECRYTCGECNSNSWSIWTSWSTCSRDCERGKQLRFQSCQNCDETARIEMRDCVRASCESLLVGPGTSTSRLRNSNIPSVCGAYSFLCASEATCINDTQVCNGYYDCSDRSDEPGTCPLGLRLDGRIVIINSGTHQCLDTTAAPDGGLIPWGFRRCPGQRSEEADRYWWRYRLGRYKNRGGLLEHQQTSLCLTVNVRNLTMGEVQTLVLVELQNCDLSFRSRQQLWECQPSGLGIRLKFPDDVLPQALRERRYLSLSDRGPGTTLEMTDRISRNRTDFYILETEQLNVCSQRQPSDYQLVAQPSLCTKTCGGGTREVLRECERSGTSSCPDGMRYMVVPCNTVPCPSFCPPAWTVVGNGNIEDVGCFKLFSLPPRNFQDAGTFCSANNWTLAADKNSQIHEAILTVMAGEPRAYIGIYEDVLEDEGKPPPHPLRYTFDHEPVGTFQPWTAISERSENREGCVLGGGGSYYGTSTSNINGESCGVWNESSTRKFDLLKELEPPYFNQTSQGNFCRNPNLDPNGPWCYNKGSDSFDYCGIPDCLDWSGEFYNATSSVDQEHVFLIRSQHGEYYENRWCLSAPRTDRAGEALIAQLWPCDVRDTRQHFYWLTRTVVVNIATGYCLSSGSGSPEHGASIAFQRCQRKLANTYQAWVGSGDYFLSGWLPESRDLETRQYRFKLEYSPITIKPYLADAGRSLFVLWTKALGSLTPSSLLQQTPGGPSVLIKGCGRCLTHDVGSGLGILRVEACSQQRSSQKWIILSDGYLMNAASGRCMNTTLQGYAIMVKCNLSDPRRSWEYGDAVAVESIDGSATTVIIHRSSRMYLRCECSGFSSVCLAPNSLDASFWEFVPGAFTIPRQRRATMTRRGSARGQLGYAFLFRSANDLRSCAKPFVSLDVSGVQPVRIFFFPCMVQDTGFYWWFSGMITQIKHRNLDLCLDADSSMIAPERNITEVEVFLKPCSLAKLDSQSWFFQKGFSMQEGNDLVGETIRLASDNSFYLSVNQSQEGGSLGLVLRKEDKRDQWEAFTLRQFPVKLSEMQDCAQPWIKMVDYRGERSWTRTGIRCQPWKSQIPWSHPYFPHKFSQFDLKENYCRRPPGPAADILDKIGHDHAWCLTLARDVRWQDCLVSRCKLPSVVTLVKPTRSWTATPGTEKLPFVCQSSGECYHEYGIDYRGLTSYTGSGLCLNWREYYNGDLSWPNHNRCLNPSGNLIRPWCWVSRGAIQYCDTLKRCAPRCFSPIPMLNRMKLAGISYTASSAMYAVGSRIQVVCKQGYNITLPEGRRDQVITCYSNGKWAPRLVQCRRVFCPNPMEMENAFILTTQAQFTYGDVVAYECRPGFMINRGQVTMQLRCQADGQWSEMRYKCLPSCPTGWMNFGFSCYSVVRNARMHMAFDEAQKQCRKEEGGTLFVPETDMEYQFARYVIMKTVGFSSDPLWVGISDSGASVMDLTARAWNPVRPDQTLYLHRMRNFHEFRIRNVGSIFEDQPKLLYTDRCMYGDRNSRKVFLKSCTFEDEEGLGWSWLTHQHLFNVDLGLCLAANMSNPALGFTFLMPNSVGLEPCDFNSARQKFTCGPHSGYLLKLREVVGSYISVDLDDRTGEIKVGGTHATGPSSQWNSIPDGFHLCHWHLKPPDTYFIVHTDVTPPGNSFTRYDTDKCLRERTGAVLATLPQTSARRNPIFDEEFLNWCQCLYMLDENGNLASASLVQGDPCARPNTAGGRASLFGVSPCHIEQRGDSLCRRTDGSSPRERPVPKWCGTISAVGPDTHFMSPRHCSSRLQGYMCETRARWLCKRPFIPVNSLPLDGSENFRNMRFAHGSNITLYCRPGYRFTSASDSITIKCNYQLQWEVAVTSFSADEMRFFTNQDMQAAAVNLRCLPIKCPIPQSVPGLLMSMSGGRERASYDFGTVVTFTCRNGTVFTRGAESHVARCSEDGSWQPPLTASMRCKTIQCAPPPAILHASVKSVTLGYGGFVNYTCPTGMWFGRNLFQLDSVCSASALWHPDPSLQGCSNVYCVVPNATEMKRTKAFVVPRLPVVVYKTNVSLTCESGFWFDKGTTSRPITCDAWGKWDPISPDKIQCSPVYCDELPIIDGASYMGSDNSGGSHVRVHCSRMTWIRPSFKIYNPHWDLCVTVEGGGSPLVDTPLHRSPFGPAPLTAALAKTCGDVTSRRDVWVWHWSFHLMNRFTNTCLTATAMPTYIDDSASVTVEECVRENTLQQWRCGSSPDGGKARFLTLRVPQRGSYLTTSTYDRAFWSQQERVYLVVSGDYTATGVENDWLIYGETDPDENICTYRAGHPFEDIRCSDEGHWIPHPSDITCSVVDCGPPPVVMSGESSVDRPTFLEMINAYFVPPNAIDNSNVFESMDSSHPVSTVVTYRCNPNTRGAFNSSLVCRENGVWQNYNTGQYVVDPEELETFICGSVTCRTPNLGGASYARIYPSSNPKLYQGRRVPMYRGYITYNPGMRLSYQPEAGTRVQANCLEGFWVMRSEVRVVPLDILQFDAPGTPYIEAECQTHGLWSDPLLESGFNCTPVFCKDPGYLRNSRRLPEPLRGSSPFGSSFLYECNPGFWFSSTQRHVDLRCNDCGIWIPPLETMRCVPSSCRYPPTVAHAIRQGDNFTVGANLSYICDNGRFLSGSNNVINTTCLASGFWFPPQSTIRCELVECAPLPEILFSSFVNFTRQHYDIFIPGDFALLLCDAGFEIDAGFVSIYFICNQRGFWEPNTQGRNMSDGVGCHRVRCPSPPTTLDSGAYNPDSATSYRFNDIVRYVCPPGLWLPPSSYGRTMATRCVVRRTTGQSLYNPTHTIQWEPHWSTFTCNSLQCAHPGIKDASRLNVGSRGFMSVATYTCEDGYRVMSPTVEGFATKVGVTCMADGLWYPNPSLVSCRAVECADPGQITFALRLTNSRLSSPFYYRDQVIYECFMGRYFIEVDDAGNELNGRINWTITCQQDGTWSARPSDLVSSCEQVSCPAPPVIANVLTVNYYVNTTDSNPSPARYPVNSRYSLSCQRGYVNSQNGLQTTVVTCSERGQWMPIDPLKITCEPLYCVDPGNYSSTSRLVDGFRLRDRITYFADRGFAFSNFPIGTPRRAVTLECTVTGQWRVLEFDYVTHEGDDTLFEENFSNFVPLILNTGPIQCPPPSPQSTVQVISSGNAPINLDQNWNTNSIISFQCNPGLALPDGSTSFSIQCTHTGHWFPDPGCISCYDSVELHSCVIPIPITDSSVRIMPQDERNVYVECYAGYEFAPSVFRILLTCGMDGVWTPDYSGMTCSPITCSPPPNVTGTTHSYTSVDYGALVTYRCPTGQSFTGYSNGSILYSVCVTSAAWDPDPAVVSCQPIECGLPDYFNVPNTLSRNVTTTTFGSTAWFRCNDNFHYVAQNLSTYDSVPATCDADGMWRLSSRDPVTGIVIPRFCRPVSCGRQPMIPNSYIISTSGTSFGSLAVVQCAPGYRANFTNNQPPTSTLTFTVRCGRIGTWLSTSESGSLPSCVPVVCPLLNSTIANGLYTYDAGGSTVNRMFQDTATLTCNPGFSTSFGGVVTLECVWYGDWAPSLRQLECMSNECPPPPQMDFSNGTGDRLVGRQWTYTCHPGYEIEPGMNEVHIDCVAPGTWSPVFRLIQKCRPLSCGGPIPFPANARAVTADGREIVPGSGARNFFIPTGTAVEFICFDGFWIASDRTNSRTVLCNITGLYNPPVTAIPSCTVIQCPSPTADIAGATAIGRLQPGLMYMFGNAIQYTCPSNQFVEDVRLRVVDVTCSDQGTFVPDPTMLSCAKVYCQMYAMAFADVLTQQTDFSLGSSITYRCNSGYWFRRGITRMTYTCNENGRWSPSFEQVHCREIECPIPAIPNLVTTSSTVKFNGEYRITCQGGYYVTGGNTFTCNENGQLVPPASSIRCNPVICSNPPLGQFTQLITTTLQFGTPVEVRCQDGYWIRPGRYFIIIHCLADGRWSRDSQGVSCVPLRCTRPPSPTNSFLVGNGTTFNSHVTVTCQPGYWFPSVSTQSAVIRCDAQGRWAPQLPPECISIRCEIPITIMHSTMVFDGSKFHSSAIYTCDSFHWIAHKNETHWVLTGEKRVVSMCGDSGSWKPYPNTDFICLSLFLGDVLINSPAVTAENTFEPSSEDFVPPYESFLRTARASWIEFDDRIMTISDSFLPDKQRRPDDIYRDVRFAWDGNPLTYWAAPTTQIRQRNEWIVDIYFGKAQAVYGLMIMCADDGQSDITTFSLVFAGVDKQYNSLGPFKVYGDSGIEGTPRTDFPINHSSTATAWEFGGLASEMLWLHIVIHGTLNPGTAPAIRELSFFASDAVWELTYPIDPTPAILLVALFSIVLGILSPVLMYVDHRYSVVTVFTPPRDRSFSKILYEISFCILLNRVPPPSINMLLRIVCTGDSHFSIPWIRGNDFPRLFRKERSYCSIILSTHDFKFCDQTCLDVLVWRVEEDPLVGYPRIVDPNVEPFIMKITDVRVVNLESGKTWRSSHEYEASVIGKIAIPYFLIPHEIRRVTMKIYYVWPLFKTCLFKLFRCHQAIAMFSPPRNSQLRRIDRLLLALFYIVAATVFTTTLQIYMGILPPANIDPSELMFNQGEDEEAIIFLRGQRGILALSSISALLCVPLSILMRYIFKIEKMYLEKQERAQDMQYVFCSHRIFFPLNVLRVPFMKILCRPLATMLSVIIRDIPQAEAAASHSQRKSHRDEIFISADRYLAKRWSFPDLHEVNEKRRFYDVVEAEVLVPGTASRERFQQGDWKLKRGCGYPESELLKVRYSGEPDLPLPWPERASRDAITEVDESVKEQDESIDLDVQDDAEPYFLPEAEDEEFLEEENKPYEMSELHRPGSALNLPPFIPHDTDVMLDEIEDFDPTLLHTAERQITDFVDKADVGKSSMSFATAGQAYRDRQHDEAEMDAAAVSAPLRIREKTFREPVNAEQEYNVGFASSNFAQYGDQEDTEAFADPFPLDSFSLPTDSSMPSEIPLGKSPSFNYDEADYLKYPAIEHMWPDQSEDTIVIDRFGGRLRKHVTMHEVATSMTPLDQGREAEPSLTEDLAAYELTSALQKSFVDSNIEHGLASLAAIIQSEEETERSQLIDEVSATIDSQATTATKHTGAAAAGFIEPSLDSSPEDHSVEISSEEQIVDVPVFEFTTTSTAMSSSEDELRKEQARFGASSLFAPQEVDSSTRRIFAELSSEEAPVEDMWMIDTESPLTESSFGSGRQRTESDEVDMSEEKSEKLLFEKLFGKRYDQRSTISSEPSLSSLAAALHEISDTLGRTAKTGRSASATWLTEASSTDRLGSASQKATLGYDNKTLTGEVPSIRTIWSIDSEDPNRRTKSLLSSQTAATSRSPALPSYTDLTPEESEPHSPLNVWRDIEVAHDDNSSSAHVTSYARTTGDYGQVLARSSEVTSDSAVSAAQTSESTWGQRSARSQISSDGSQSVIFPTTEEGSGVGSSDQTGSNGSQYPWVSSAPFPSGFINRELPKIKRIFPTASEEKIEKMRSYRPLSEMNYLTLEETSNNCTGNPRLHHPVVTHVSQREPICPIPLDFHHFLTLFVLGGIIGLFVYLLWLGQNISTIAAGPVYRGAYFTFLATFTFGLLLDAIIGRYIFKEV